MKEKIEQFADYVRQADSIVFFGGAGVSTESGLPDYRSNNGRYTAMEEEGLDPTKIMHINYIKNHPREFFNREKKNDQVIEPNNAHVALANLEQMGKEVHIVTQNVDGLHQKAGSTSVYELHGSDRTWFCMDCGNEIKQEEVTWEDGLPTCQICSGLMRPAVTYFGENPDINTIEASRDLIAQADLLIIAGTSLRVSPAKRLIQSFQGSHAVVINEQALTIRKLPIDLTFDQAVGRVMSALMRELREE